MLKELLPHRWISIRLKSGGSVFGNGTIKVHSLKVEIVDEHRSLIIGRGATLAEALEKVRAWKKGNDG